MFKQIVIEIRNPHMAVKSSWPKKLIANTIHKEPRALKVVSSSAPTFSLPSLEAIYWIGPTATPYAHKVIGINDVSGLEFINAALKTNSVHTEITAMFNNVAI